MRTYKSLKVHVLDEHGVYSIATRDDQIVARALERAVADSIAHALNCHDDLVGALSQAVRFFEMNGGDPDYTWLPELRAALDKAKYRE